MNWTEVLPGIAIMAGTTYLVRVIPLLLFKNKITNRTIKAFLYFVPYAVLSAMTIPDVFSSTGNGISTAAGLVTAVLLAWYDKGLLIVSLGAALASVVVTLVM